MRAFSALEELSHWLVRRPYLYLHKVRSLIVTPRTSADCDLIDILPGIFTSHYIVYFFAFEGHLLFKGFLHGEDVRTGLAKETEAA